MLPLFPLSTVLFPGVVLPLHVFEPRYRLMMKRLLAASSSASAQDPESGEFGVVAIRQGWEVGTHGVSALHVVGCTARLRQIEDDGDGGFNIVTVGTTRFQLGTVDDTEPYLRAEVTRLPDEVGDGARAKVLARSVRIRYAEYLARLAETQAVAADEPELPEEPLILSHLVAATAPLTLEDRQVLLAAQDAAARLRLELGLLRRETTMLQRVRAVPVPLAELQVPQSAS